MKIHIFAANMRVLRKTHNISQFSLAQGLRLKSKGTIGLWETEKNYPTTDMLCSISDFFGINIDWLLGRSTEPYSNGVLSELESIIIPEIQCFKPPKSSGYGDLITQEIILNNFLDDDIRVKKFSLGIRANIIFCINKYKARNMHHVIGDEHYFEALYIPTPDETESFNDYMFNDLRKDQIFVNLVQGKYKEPIYDIRKSTSEV